MPPGVRFPPSPANAQEPNYNVNALVDFWIPAPSKPAELKAPFWNVVGRLRDGTTTRQAQGELKVAAATQAQADHDFEGFTPEVHSLTAEMNRDGGRILLPLLGAAALDRVRECGGSVADARPATAAGIRRPQRIRRRPSGAFPASIHREPPAGFVGRRAGRGPGPGGRQVVQGDWRTRRPASGRGFDRLADAGL